MAKYSRTSAAAPAAVGAAKDVPAPTAVEQLSVEIEKSLAAETLYPGATTSGLMRPSAAGPTPEKSERSSSEPAGELRVDPTHTTFLPFPGEGTDRGPE